MPYISEKWRRSLISDQLKQLLPLIEKSGDLNFTITLLCWLYLQKKGESYDNWNAILGVLSAVDKEIYRRKIAIYEDGAISRNGDIFGRSSPSKGQSGECAGPRRDE